jgi:hypothetical protein
MNFKEFRPELPRHDARTRRKVERERVSRRREHTRGQIEARAVPRALQRPASEQRVELIRAGNIGFNAGQRHGRSAGELDGFVEQTRSSVAGRPVHRNREDAGAKVALGTGERPSMRMEDILFHLDPRFAAAAFSWARAPLRIPNMP